MTVLVTGGAGFIGTHVVNELRARGQHALVLDRRNIGVEGSIFGSITDSVAVMDAAAHADAIIHLAGVLGTQETIDNPYPAAHTNILGGLNVLDAARRYKLPLVNIAVGNHWMDNPYSITKSTVERFVKMYRTEHGLTAANVRVMNAYGPGQVPAAPYGPSKVRKIGPAFICRALTQTPIEIYGDGSQIMDMVHVSDVACGLIDAIGTNDDIEIGTGRRSTVKQIAEKVIEEVGEGELRFLPMRPGEPAQSVVVAQKADPSFVRLEHGLKDTVAFYRDEWLPGWSA